MTILIAPDSFKGTLTAQQAAEAIARGAESAFPDADGLLLPLADGGEGTLDALLAAGGERRHAEVEGPRATPVSAQWGVLPDGAGVVEMAQASGLHWVDPETNDLRTATSYGAGQLIRAAIEAGCKRIVVGIGGSATNDGGKGAMAALGARFTNEAGGEVDHGAAGLAQVTRIDLENFVDIAGVDVEVATDVDNPLLGPDGATYTFGPQKGGSPEILDEIEAGMANYARVLRKTFGWDVAAAAGAGAAGGIGAALLAFMGAQFRSGVDVVMDAVGFEDAALSPDVRLIITGEGSLDTQSLRGKAISGVLRRSNDTPVIALCGRVSLGEEAWRAWGLAGAWGLANDPATAGDALTHPALALERLTASVLLQREHLFGP
jgi:glycerate kinase